MQIKNIWNHHLENWTLPQLTEFRTPNLPIRTCGSFPVGEEIAVLNFFSGKKSASSPVQGAVYMTPSQTSYTPEDERLEQNHGGLVQIIFLSKWVICRFQPLLFQGVTMQEKKNLKIIIQILASSFVPPQKKMVSHVMTPGPIPIGSMYGIFTYLRFKFMVNVAAYTIHGSYGYLLLLRTPTFSSAIARSKRWSSSLPKRWRLLMLRKSGDHNQLRLVV